MIDQKELAKVREINRALPFAHPIEQGDEPKTRFFFAPIETISDPPSIHDVDKWIDVTHALVPDSIEFTYGI